MKQFAAYFFGLALLSSCAYHGGMMTGNAELNSNSEIVSFAIGESKAVHVLGIGGLDSKTLVKDAKEDLYSRYPLKKGQAYANVVVDFRKAFYLFFDVTTVSVSADIVNLNATETSDELQSVFETKEVEGETPLYPDLWVQHGDSVFFVRNGQAEKVSVREILWEKKVTVTTQDFQITSARVSRLYSDKKGLTFPGIPYKPADSVKYNLEVADGLYSEVTAVVKGVNPEGLLIALGSRIVEVNPEEVSIDE